MVNNKSVSNYSLSIPPQSVTKSWHMTMLGTWSGKNLVVKQEVDNWRT